MHETFPFFKKSILVFLKTVLNDVVMTEFEKKTMSNFITPFAQFTQRPGSIAKYNSEFGLLVAQQSDAGAGYVSANGYTDINPVLPLALSATAVPVRVNQTTQTIQVVAKLVLDSTANSPTQGYTYFSPCNNQKDCLYAKEFYCYYANALEVPFRLPTNSVVLSVVAQRAALDSQEQVAGGSPSVVATMLPGTQAASKILSDAFYSLGVSGLLAGVQDANTLFPFAGLWGVFYSRILNARTFIYTEADQAAQQAYSIAQLTNANVSRTMLTDCATDACGAANCCTKVLANVASWLYNTVAIPERPQLSVYQFQLPLGELCADTSFCSPCLPSSGQPGQYDRSTSDLLLTLKIMSESVIPTRGTGLYQAARGKSNFFEDPLNFVSENISPQFSNCNY